MSIDFDQVTSGVTGAPSTWDAQCCKLVMTAIEHADGDFTALATAYIRVEIILGAEALADNEEQSLAWVYHAAATSKAIGIFLRQVSGALVWRFRVYESSVTTPTLYTTTTGLALDTPYRLECKWDSVGDAWEIRQNNTTLFSGALTDTPAAGQLDNILLGNPWQTGPSVTYYVDNVAVADDDWIGGETLAPGTYDVALLAGVQYPAVISM